MANLTERFDLVALLVLPFSFRLFPTVLMNKLRSATITQEGELGKEARGVGGGDGWHGLLAVGSFFPLTAVGEILSRKVANGQ